MSMIHNGIEYLDEDAETFPDGSVHDATLAHDSDIQGLPCAGGHSVVLFPNGSLRLAWLSRTTTVGGVCCASGIVYLCENGTIFNATLATSLNFADVTLPAGTRVTLDEEGRLLEYSRQLPADQIIDGLPCAAEFNIWLYPSGRLSRAVLASSSVVDQQEFTRGTELFLGEDGEVIQSYCVDLDSGERYKQRIFGVYEAQFE